MAGISYMDEREYYTKLKFQDVKAPDAILTSDWHIREKNPCMQNRRRVYKSYVE